MYDVNVNIAEYHTDWRMDNQSQSVSLKTVILVE